MKKILKNQRGLTLIELLAVIVILGIIAAIAVPAIGNVIQSSKEKATVTEAIQIIDAAKLAKTENPSATSFTYEGEENSVSLKGFVDKIKEDDKDFKVTYSEDGVYSISSHDANSHVASGTESDLADFVDGN